MEFRQTNIWGANGKTHYHIVFLDEESGLGFCGAAGEDDHVHLIKYFPPQEEAYDDYGNITQEAMPGRWIIMPAGYDNHIHDTLNLYEPKYQEPRPADSEILQEVCELYDAAVQLEEESKKLGEEAVGFYSGRGQWNKEDKQYLETLDRACLTINEVESVIDMLIGYHLENRTEIHYTSQEPTDQAKCDVFNIALKYLLKRCGFDAEETRVVFEQLVLGRGNYSFHVNFEKDLRGEPAVESFPNMNVYYGAHLKLDASDAEYVIKEKMYSLGRLKSEYKDKVKKLTEAWAYYESAPIINYQPFSAARRLSGLTTGDNYNSPDRSTPVEYIMSNSLAGKEMLDITKKNVRVLECQRKYWVEASVAVYKDGEFFQATTTWKSEDVKQLKTMRTEAGVPVFDIVQRTVPQLEIAKIGLGVVLDWEKPVSFPNNEFYIVPVYAKKLDDFYYGKIEALKDPQREVNKRHSQMIDIGNKMCAYGFWYDSMTFDDPKLEYDFKRLVSSPGFALKVNDIQNKPIKEEGIKFPTELAELLELGSRKIREIANVVIEEGGQNETFIHLLQKTKQKIVGNQYLFENQRLAKEQVGRLFIGLIQMYFDGTRLARLLNSQDNTQQIGGVPADEYSIEELDELINTADVDDFDIVVGESAINTSSQLMEYAVLKEFAAAGGEVPPEMMLEVANLPAKRKAKMMEMIQQNQASMQQQQQEQGDSEIIKTIISKTGIIPPATAQRLQIPAQAGMQQQMPEGAVEPQMGDNVEGLPEQGGTVPRVPKTKKVWKDIDPETGKEVVMIQEM